VDTPSEIGTLLAVGIAQIVLGQIRVIEERENDPAQRWILLRRSLSQFVSDNLKDAP
jgi:hypothetical protein